MIALCEASLLLALVAILTFVSWIVRGRMSYRSSRRFLETGLQTFTTAAAFFIFSHVLFCAGPKDEKTESNQLSENETSDTIRREDKKKREGKRRANQASRSINFTVERNEDVSSSFMVKRVRTLLVEKGTTGTQVRDLLHRYHHDLWREIQSNDAEYKAIHIWVYDDKSKLTKSRGEWIGIINNSGSDRLPEWPEPEIKSAE